VAFRKVESTRWLHQAVETWLRAEVFVNPVMVDLHSIVRNVLHLALISTWDDEVVSNNRSKIMLGRHRWHLMLLLRIPLESHFLCFSPLAAIVDAFEGSTVGLRLT